MDSGSQARSTALPGSSRSGWKLGLVRQLHRDLLPIAESRDHLCVAPSEDRGDDGGRDGVSGRIVPIGEHDLFWSNRQDDRGADLGMIAAANHPDPRNIHNGTIALACRHGPFQEVRLSDEIGHEAEPGTLVDLGRRRQLATAALVHDGDPVGHRQRLFLIVGDIDEGDADALLQAISSSCIALRSFRSSAPSGSSSRSTAGWLTSARASATRCCWPPES